MTDQIHRAAPRSGCWTLIIIGAVVAACARTAAPVTENLFDGREPGDAEAPDVADAPVLQDTAPRDTVQRADVSNDVSCALDPFCDPSPPRPIAPLSNSSTTSQRPVFRWALAEDTEGVSVEICRTRACDGANLAQTFVATGTSATATGDLAAGTWFWRLRGRHGGSTGTRSGPMWQFHTGVRSAPHASNWGSVPDVNGDGYPDGVVGVGAPSIGSGRIYVYPGNGRSLASLPTVLAAPSGSRSFATSLRSAGDVDGDGYCDVVVGAPGSSALAIRDRAYLFRGGPDGLRAESSLELPNPAPGTQFGYSVTGAGDVDGDGYGDILVGAPYAGVSGESVYVSRGRAYLFWGGPTGTSGTPAILDGALPDGALGRAVTSAGDLNGDGLADFAVSAPLAFGPPRRHRVYVYFGNPERTLAAPLVLSALDEGVNELGQSIDLGGDLNGDGYSELLIGAPSAMTGDLASVYVLWGGPDVATQPHTQSLRVAGSPYFGVQVRGAGDLNGDGFSDLIVSNGSTSVCYYGSLSGPAMQTDLPRPFPGSDGCVGCAFGMLGDANGDGYGDLLLSATETSRSSETVYLYVGSSVGLDGSALVVGTPADAVPDFGLQFASASYARRRSYRRESYIRRQ